LARCKWISLLKLVRLPLQSCISLHLSSELLSHILITLFILICVFHPYLHQKVINTHFYLIPLLLHSTSQTIPLSSILSQCYSTYSIAPSSPILFYDCSLYVIVTDSISHQLYVSLLLSLWTLLHLLCFILWPL
jgi:hypothetical protein